MPKPNTEALLRCLSRNLVFHALIANEIRQSPFGQQTYNVTLVDGVANLATLTIVKQRRRRYKKKGGKDGDKLVTLKSIDIELKKKLEKIANDIAKEIVDWNAKNKKALDKS